AINNSVITNNGLINLTATGGSVTMGSGTALVAGNQAINVLASSSVSLEGISGGALNADAKGGSLWVNGVIDGSTGNVVLNAQRDININNAILNTRNG